jgi:error-prone DNA polymerase
MSWRAADGLAPRAAPWAELHCHSSYSFLDGAATPAELVTEAARLGLEVLALTDHDGMYGVPQFAQAAAKLRDQGIGLGTVFGAELSLSLPSGQTGVPDPEGQHLLVLARDPEGYARLCAVISAAQLAGGEKGRPVYDVAALAGAHDGHWVVLTGCRKGAVPAALAATGPDAAWRELTTLTEMFGHENVMVELTCRRDPGDDERNDVLARLAALADVGLVAAGNVHFAVPAQARLAQALAAIRARRSLAEMDGWLPAAGTAYLRSGAEMAALLRRYPGVIERTAALGRDCAFNFNVIAPRLPDFGVPAGHTEASWLRELVARKAPARYGRPEAERIPGAYAQIARELDVIEQLDFPGYFLIVHDIVEFCAQENILCQGRGSAANSAVCFAIGITSVDPVSHHLLFERFLSQGRDGPPDIDLDIEHRRREEVIQYVYRTYGRTRAAQVANVISYRPRLALRDAGRALGFTPAQSDAWVRQIGPGPAVEGEALEPGHPDGPPAAVIELATQMQRLPRHLGIHSGGMVICDRPVGQVCPVEWARMPGRTVLQWDKDDCAYAGLVKFDLLGLGMLAALHDCFDLVAEHHGERWEMATLPQEDPAVYQMLSEADTVGVFQVESRAQMATLPRLRPSKFYDLVIEVALIRPGPIQGGSVHPYLRRRDGRQEAAMPHELMRPALEKTLGVPLFQEQMMQLAIDCAGFTPSEADRLRQAMSSKRAPERIEELRRRLLDGMAERGIGAAVAQDIYEKILAFSSFGFPESHAISFAYLVYASAWLKRYFPAAFTTALLRNQPMGFYAPHSLINDARRHGVTVHGVDVNASEALATLEASGAGPVIRLGLASVRNLSRSVADQVAAGRSYRDLEDFALRTQLPAVALEALATAGAFGCFGLSRRAALWAAGAAASLREGQLPGTTTGLDAPPLPAMTPAEQTLADLWATSTYGTHPLAHIRAALAARQVLTVASAKSAPDGAEVAVGGLVTHRQRPPTARGVVFISLEDETGMLNVICPPQVWDRHRRIATVAPALAIWGRIERTRGAVNLVAAALYPLRVTSSVPSRDFR